MAGLTNETVLEALKKVVDPELGLNLVDLGLIYEVQVEDGKVRVEMTLTTPGCPLHDSLTQAVYRVLYGLEGVKELNVEVVWDPPWTPERISAQGRKQLEERR
ncbi:MAG: metal-sulfur cluster assembly factor [Candidatus Tectomicrobia bacterium]|uniref:Metal-sulfur cluster assembly factor n=1 Tax=Tectimicrobiota bacterium TaxID=2528274 RepID=A0A932M2H9_UNCTE|nr:metal-sulfur cluster assembly factor [Candidatus Tectomicrobia bacterium]